MGTIGTRTCRPPVEEEEDSFERGPRVPNTSTAPPPLSRHEISPRHELALRDMHDELVGTIGAGTWRPPVEEVEEGSFKRSPPFPVSSNTAGDSDVRTGARGQNSEKFF